MNSTTPRREALAISVSPSVALSQPAAGDRQREQHLLLVIGRYGREELVQCGTGLVHLPVDQWPAHAMLGRESRDRLRTCHGVNGHELAIGGVQLLAPGAFG